MKVKFTMPDNNDLKAQFNMDKSNTIATKVELNAETEARIVGDETLNNKIDNVILPLATKSELENEVNILDNKIDTVADSIPDISGLATKQELEQVEESIPDISNLATKDELQIVENEIPDVSGFATKTELQSVENEIPTKASDIGALPDTTVIGDGILTLQKNGVNIDTFNANATANKSINITVPTQANDVGALPDTTTINDLTTIAQQNALNSGATATNIGQITTNANGISDIQDLIPNQASSSNQLADKDFVNSSIATNTANFIGTFNSVAELEAYSGTLTNNDYAFVATTDSAGNTLYDRYKYSANTQEWLFEYELNNSSFTAVQWASINSGATSTNIGQITTNANNIADLQTNKQNVISDLTTIRSNALAGKNASDTIATYGNIVTHNVSEFATSSQGALADTALQPSNVDSALSTLSENPVQNKVITSALPDIANLSYYGTCSTGASTQAKVVVCPEFTELKTGVSIRVKFTNNQTYNGAPTLNVNSTGAKSVKSNGTTSAVRYCWLAGEVVSFTYDGTNWIMEDAGIASTTYYGYTKLTSGATSTGTATALTPTSLNSLVQNMIEPYPVYSTSSTYEVGDRVRRNYQAWECITAITTGETWTDAHWIELDPIQTQIDKLQNEVKTNTLTIGNTTITESQLQALLALI